MKLKTLVIALTCLAATVGCSEDKNINSAIEGPLYSLEKGAPGTLDAMIYDQWERTGCYYLYKCDQSAWRVKNFTSRIYNWATDVQPQDTDLVRRVIDIIHTDVFKGMSDDFVHRNWYVRTFFVDSLASKSSGKTPLQDYYLDQGNYLIIPNIGNRMRAYTETNWETLKNQFSELLISRLYLGASSQPNDFFALRAKKANGKEVSYIYGTDWIEDPNGKYSKHFYTYRTYGYIKSKPNTVSNETIFVPDKQLDVAQYILFLNSSTKTELDDNFATFALVKKRAKALIPYLLNVLNLDLVAMQNAKCPNDPVGSDYFTRLVNEK